MAPKRKYIHEVYTRPVYGKSRKLQQAVFDSTQLLQRLQLDLKLDIHNGCVNTIVWNESGSLLLSGSDDHNLVITDIFQPKPVSNLINTPHSANIISAQFLSGSSSTKLVSCADSTIIHTDINKPEQFSPLQCHSSKVYELLSVSGDPHSFLTCGEDGTVRWVDTRVHSSCTDNTCQKEVIIEGERGIGSICLNPLFSWELAVGSSDSCVRIYDRRMLSTKSVSTNFNSGLTGLFSKFTVPDLEGKSRRITSVKYRPDGGEVLVSFSSDYLYVFNPRDDGGCKKKKLKVGRPSLKWKKAQESQQQQSSVKKFRLRGDWSDTGPRSRPEAEAVGGSGADDHPSGGEGGRDGASSQAALMQRMTFALSRMLNDPGTRLAMQRLGNRSRNNSNRESEEANNTGDQQNNPDDTSSNDETNQNAVPGTSGSQPNTSRPSSNSRGSNVASDTLETNSASLIQERWRQYREKKLADRNRNIIQVETTNSALADSLLQPQVEESEIGEDSSEESTDSEYTSDNDSIQNTSQHDDTNNDRNDPNESDITQQSNDVTRAETTTNNEEACDTNINQRPDPTQDPPDPIPGPSNIEKPRQSSGEASKLNDEQIATNEGETADESANREVNKDTNENTEFTNETNESQMEDLENSYSNLVQAGVQPNLQFRYGEEGASSSSIQLQSDSLPGPMRVVTGAGQSGVDPVTGARRRRTGVSSVPTSSILPEHHARTTDDTEEKSGEADQETQDLVEYEYDYDQSESDDEGESAGRNILQPPVLNKFTGHRNVRTLILEGAWWGENHVLSGSDCGHFFGWDRSSTDIVMMREADRHVVNRVRPHPYLPVLATSGIDHDVKIWSPTSEEAAVSTSEDVQVVTKRNQVMLEETRDTITVPASLMIRMLASLNQIRRGPAAERESRDSN